MFEFMSEKASKVTTLTQKKKVYYLSALFPPDGHYLNYRVLLSKALLCNRLGCPRKFDIHNKYYVLGLI